MVWLLPWQLFSKQCPHFHTQCGSTYEDHVLRWIVWLSDFLFAFCVKKPEKLWEILQKGNKIDNAPCVRFSWWIRSGKFATNNLVNKLEVFKFLCYFIFWGWVPPYQPKSRTTLQRIIFVKKPEKLWEILQKGNKIDNAPCVRFSWWIRSGKFATNNLVNKLEVSSSCAILFSEDEYLLPTEVEDNLTTNYDLRIFYINLKGLRNGGALDFCGVLPITRS